MKKTFEDNLKEIEAFLASYKRNTLPHFINGARILHQLIIKLLEKLLRVILLILMSHAMQLSKLLMNGE
jgi:hypothetical protein